MCHLVLGPLINARENIGGYSFASEHDLVGFLLRRAAPVDDQSLDPSMCDQELVDRGGVERVWRIMVSVDQVDQRGLSERPVETRKGVSIMIMCHVPL